MTLLPFEGCSGGNKPSHDAWVSVGITYTSVGCRKENSRVAVPSSSSDSRRLRRQESGSDSSGERTARQNVPSPPPPNSRSAHDQCSHQRIGGRLERVRFGIGDGSEQERRVGIERRTDLRGGCCTPRHAGLSFRFLRCPGELSSFRTPQRAREGKKLGTKLVWDGS